MWPRVFGNPARSLGNPGKVGTTYAAYVASLSPVVWHRFNETSGTDITNYGSFGANQKGVWTAGSGALGQTGKLGANEAYDFDALASKDTITQTSTNIGNLAVYTQAVLCYLDGNGEGNVGTFFEIGTLGGVPTFRLAASMALVSNEWDGGSTCTSSSLASFAPTSAWVWLFNTFDNTGDRKLHLYKGISGAVTEATYNSQVAMSGTRAGQGTAVTIGNNSAGSRTIDGLIDEVLIFSSALTSAQMTTIVQASGV